MNQTKQNVGGADIVAGALTSYGLPARIDGIDVDQLLRTLNAQHNETLALHRQLAGQKLRADQGWARAAAKSRECIELRERIAGAALLKTQDEAGIPASVQLLRETAGDAGAAPTCRSSASTSARPDQLALELPTVANRATATELDENMLSTVLWLYRRLPHGYGRLAVIEGPIKALARKVGIDVADCLAERDPKQTEGSGDADERT